MYIFLIHIINALAPASAHKFLAPRHNVPHNPHAWAHYLRNLVCRIRFIWRDIFIRTYMEHTLVAHK